MATLDDTRNGLGYSKSFQIQYEGLKNLGKSPDGLDKFIYFTKVPWIIVKTTRQKIAQESYWNQLIEKMKSDYKDLANGSTGIYIESVNVGEQLIIDGVSHYAGSYVEADYRNAVGDLPTPYNLLEWSGGQASPSGFWDDNGRSNLHGRAFFNSPVFGEVGYKSYTDIEAKESIGEKATIAGVNGIVSNVSRSNPRLINNVLVYDFSVQVYAGSGTSIGV